MSRLTTKQQLIDEIIKEQQALSDLLQQIPANRRTEPVVDNMSIKDILAHRTEWGRMMINWYTEAKAGNTPSVPSKKYKWNQLKQLNADIYSKYNKTELGIIEEEFNQIQSKLLQIVKSATEEELFTKKYYDFTGGSDLAAYFNSATAAHYRSARKYIQKWWKTT